MICIFCVKAKESQQLVYQSDLIIIHRNRGARLGRIHFD